MRMGWMVGVVGLSLAACRPEPETVVRWPRSAAVWVSAGARGAWAAGVARQGDEEAGAVWVQRLDMAGWPVGRRRWLPTPPAAAPALHPQVPPVVVEGREGRVAVVWVHHRSVPGAAHPRGSLWVAWSRDGGRTFAPPRLVGDAPDLPAEPRNFFDAVFAADGALVLAWLQHGGPGPGTRTVVGRLAPDGRLTAVVLDTTACPCCRVALAAAPDGRVAAAWRSVFPGNVRDIVVAVSPDDGRTFGSVRRVAVDNWVFPGCPHAGPAVAFDGAGRLAVAWWTGREGEAGVRIAWTPAGRLAFRPPILLERAPRMAPAQVRLASAPTGWWVAWEDPLAPQPRVRLVELSAATGRRRSLGWIPGATPALARSREGLLVAVRDPSAATLRRLP